MSHEKLKALNLEDLNERVEALIQRSVTENKSLNTERNQLQTNLDKVQCCVKELEQQNQSKDEALGDLKKNHQAKLLECEDLCGDKSKLLKQVDT